MRSGWGGVTRMEIKHFLTVVLRCHWLGHDWTRWAPLGQQKTELARALVRECRRCQCMTVRNIPAGIPDLPEFYESKRS